MDADRFEAVARSLYGDHHWQASLAADLGVRRESVRNWAAGRSRVPPGVEIDLQKRVLDRLRELGALAG